MKKVVSWVVILSIILSFSACGDTVKTRSSSETYIGMLYDDVLDELQKTGFTDIKPTEIADLTSDGDTPDYTVEKVLIDGNSTFEKKTEFLKTAPVEIVYHIIKKIELPVSSEEVLAYDYIDLGDTLESLGFVNVTVQEVYDLDPDTTSEDKVNELLINDSGSFSKNQPIPFDAKISVMCHRLFDKFTVNMDVVFPSNLIFSKYDVNVFIDDEPLGTLNHGESSNYVFRIKSGLKTVKFEKVNDEDINGTVVLDVKADLDVDFKIHSYRDRVDVSVVFLEYHIGSKGSELMGTSDVVATLLPTATPTLTTQPTSTPTPISTPTPTLSSTATPAPSSTPTPTATPKPTPSPTLTPSSTPTPTATPKPTPSPTLTPSSTPTPTATPKPTPSPTPTPTPTPVKTGWQKIAGGWEYRDSTGKKETGWLQLGSVWYYLNTQGVMQTSWQEIKSNWYYFNESGEMQTGWKKIGSDWYYLNNSGEMQTGWQEINGKWYYLKPSGAMAANTTIDGYRINADGVYVPETTAKPTSRGQHYVVNTNTRKFHRPNCPSVDQMKASNRMDVTATREELILQYEPCQRCNP